MKIIDLIRLVRKHIVVLIMSPILLAGLVIYLTKNPDLKFASETTLFTGIASGTSVEMDKSFSYFANNTAFDNLINVIKSRETHEEVAVRLLSLHLLLDKADNKFISGKSYANLKRITPAYIEKFIVKGNSAGLPNTENKKTVPDNSLPIDSSEIEQFSFSKINQQNELLPLPPTVSQEDFEQTVKNLTEYMNSSDTNFVYRLLNFDSPHYSINAISSVSVQRISNSDLVRIKYTCDDPGICQQTLFLLTKVCVRNYREIKENRSDAVVKYFEFQLNQAAEKLKVAEDKLLEFNKSNNIINYYEQSKAVAIVKEDLEVEYNNKRIKLAGIQAAIERLEEKMDKQELVQIKSSKIIDTRNKLGELNYQISSAETMGGLQTDTVVNLVALKVEAEKLKEEIKTYVRELYSYNNSVNGLPLETLLNEWITNIIEEQYLQSGIEVLGERIIEFQKQYAIYAPAGANIKRIEREISVSEQEFLEILHGLNLAKLKLQDNELSSNLKTVDPPFYPISPIPTKRKIIILAAGMLGFIIVLVLIFVLEYFDDTLKNQSKASRILQLPYLGIFPRILESSGKINLPFIWNRLLEMTIQKIELLLYNTDGSEEPKTLLVYSTLNDEGKSVIAGNLARKMKAQGKKVLVLNYSKESLRVAEITQPGYTDTPLSGVSEHTNGRKKRKPYLKLLLGYSDDRINYDSLFLESPEKYLDEGEIKHYQVNEDFYSTKNYKELIEQNQLKVNFVPDYVLLELPPVLYFPYPVKMISGADLCILVCRSNRVWTEADQGVMDNLINLNKDKTHFILNGADLNAIESVLGDLPKKRSRLRRLVKNLVRFQFYTKSHI